MATKLEQATRELAALDALKANDAFKQYLVEVQKERAGYIEQVCAREADGTDRAWTAGYIVGLSGCENYIEARRRKAEATIKKEDRE